MKIYQTPEIAFDDLSTKDIGVVLCNSDSVSETEGFQEYQLITDEE